ncbi:MAG: AbrB/MazE/SpoVT family DNA-binding domain-containing protein [Clostridia bacterium]|nr:AbrB/MazE/SpoVT family DNA-binding domain-containing protein [Clostridia bacterium]
MSGIERRIDKVGRIVLPKSYVKKLGIKANDKLSISLKDNLIIVCSVEKLCALCGAKLLSEEKIQLCALCISKVQKLKID